MSKFVTKEIEVEINEDLPDVFQIETLEGIEGGECTEILDKLNSLIDGDIVEVSDKPEKNKKQKIVQKQKQTK